MARIDQWSWAWLHLPGGKRDRTYRGLARLGFWAQSTLIQEVTEPRLTGAGGRHEARFWRVGKKRELCGEVGETGLSAYKLSKEKSSPASIPCMAG